MRAVIVLGSLLLVGALAAACAYWAGAAQGAPIAFALAGFAVAVIVPVAVGQLGNWGAPGDEPALHWRHSH